MARLDMEMDGYDGLNLHFGSKLLKHAVSMIDTLAREGCGTSPHPSSGHETSEM